MIFRELSRLLRFPVRSLVLQRGDALFKVLQAVHVFGSQLTEEFKNGVNVRFVIRAA